MTDREVMKLALEALEAADDWIETKQAGELNDKAIAALRQALEQPEEEPVAWGFQNTAITGSNRWMYLRETIPTNDQYRGVLWTPLYTAPPKREWQGLTDVEVGWLTVFDGLHHVETPVLADFIRAIEAKLKEKNNG